MIPLTSAYVLHYMTSFALFQIIPEKYLLGYSYTQNHIDSSLMLYYDKNLMYRVNILYIRFLS